MNTYYDEDDLGHFFIKIVGVSRLNIQMVYDELQGVDRQTATVQQVKSLFWTMNAFPSTETPKGTPERILKRPVFPVMYPSGDVHLVTIDTEFAIVDRRPLEVKFRDRIKLLDFTLNEVHELDPFLDWAKLKSRFLSNITKEISVVNPVSTCPVSNSTRNIKRKAHALTRYLFLFS